MKLIILVCCLLFIWSIGVQSSSIKEVNWDELGELLDKYEKWTGMKSYTGYIDIKEREGGKMFFWFVEADTEPDEKPLMLWLNGGPGCASMIGLFEQNGPFRLNPKASAKKGPWDMEKFEGSWHKHANMLYVDQPVGAGFSIVNDAEKNGASTATEAAKDLITFLKEWLKETKFKKFLKRDFYVAGESYAGKYIPSLMYEFDKLDEKNKVPLNWVGTLIGNGMMKPTIQYQVYAEHAYAFGIHFGNDLSKMSRNFSTCHERVKQKKFDDITEEYCQGPFTYLIKEAGGLDPFDVRQTREDMERPSNHYMHHFQFKQEFREILGLKEGKMGDPAHYARCNSNIGKAFKKSGDKHMDLSDSVISHLLDHPTRKLLIYSGQFDLRVDSLGTSELLRIYPWKHQLEMNAQVPVQIQNADKKVIGRAQQAGKVTFMLLYGASHLTDEFHPMATQQMVERFIKHADGGVCSKGTCHATSDNENTKNKCFNACSGPKQGNCDQGVCKCHNMFTGSDCSLFYNDKFDGDQFNLTDLSIAGRGVQLYRLKLNYRLQPLMNVNVVLNVKRGTPIPFLNLTDTAPDDFHLEQKQFKYSVESLRRHPNWDPSLVNFRFSNLTRPVLPINQQESLRSHLSGNLVLSSFKDNFITIGIYNDHDGLAEFSLSLTMSPSETFLPHYWFFFGGSAVFVPIAVALLLLIIRQSRRQINLDSAAPYTALIDGKTSDFVKDTPSSSLLDSDDDLEMANYAHS